jgi:putative inorganic carbon (HCO3(-)) transporter
LILFLGLLYAGPANQGAFLDTASLAERAPGWARGLDALRAFPLTGCGLGTFRQIAHLFGPLPLAAPEPYDLAHAHNIFLQVALDLGLPGLVGYLAVVGAALWCAWRVARMACAPFAWLAPGIAGSLVAFHAYGLADTVALGAKPGLALWLLLALAAVLWTTNAATGQQPAALDAPGDPGP